MVGRQFVDGCQQQAHPLILQDDMLGISATYSSAAR